MNRAILTICFLLSAPLAARPCTITIRSHASVFREAKAIFIGTAAEIGLNNSDDAELRHLAPYKIRFRVEKVWKGSGPEITVISDNGKICGGFQFREGERYLVYAHGEELLVENWSSRSRPLGLENEDTRRELRQLNSFCFRWKARLWRF